MGQDRQRERAGVEACRAVWLCKCLCSTWNVCELLLLLLHKTVHIFECHMGEGAERGVTAFFALCRLHLNILHMRQVASNGGWRCKALSTRTLQSLHSALYLSPLPPATSPLSRLPAHTVPICRQVCFATQAWKTPSKSSVKFWPSYLLINAKEEGRKGKASAGEREGKERRRRRLLDFGLRFASHVNFLPKHQSIVWKARERCENIQSFQSKLFLL